MKQTIFLFLLFVASFAANAQFASVTAKTAAGVDSAIVTDTGSANLLATFSKPHASVGFLATFTKTSGTLGGTAKLQGSYDNSNWFDVGTNYTVTNTASQVNSWVVAGSAFPFRYARILWSGTGTMAGRFRLKVYSASF